MPKSGADRLMELEYQLENLQTKHTLLKEIAVEYFQQLIMEELTYEPEEFYLSELESVISALSQDKFTGQDLPCFKVPESTAHRLQQFGHFAKAQPAYTESLQKENLEQQPRRSVAL